MQSQATLRACCERTPKTPCGGLYFEYAKNKRRDLAFAQRVRQRVVVRLWQHCKVFKSAVGALRARRVHAVKTPCNVFGVGVCNAF